MTLINRSAATTRIAASTPMTIQKVGLHHLRQFLRIIGKRLQNGWRLADAALRPRSRWPGALVDWNTPNVGDEDAPGGGTHRAHWADGRSPTHRHTTWQTSRMTVIGSLAKERACDRRRILTGVRHLGRDLAAATTLAERALADAMGPSAHRGWAGGRSIPRRGTRARAKLALAGPNELPPIGAAGRSCAVARSWGTRDGRRGWRRKGNGSASPATSAATNAELNSRAPTGNGRVDPGERLLTTHPPPASPWG